MAGSIAFPSTIPESDGRHYHKPTNVMRFASGPAPHPPYLETTPCTTCTCGVLLSAEASCALLRFLPPLPLLMVLLLVLSEPLPTLMTIALRPLGAIVQPVVQEQTVSFSTAIVEFVEGTGKQGGPELGILLRNQKNAKTAPKDFDMSQG
eukprot:scaffold225440_cov19-Tisochrysis_lutea.AAC.1